MSFFNKIFGSTETGKVERPKINWNALNEVSQLELIVEESKNKPIVIFKHSTSCGISRMALNGFERGFNVSEDIMKLYFLDLLNHRKLSNEVASRFGVWHESPQLLVLKDGKVIYHASHGQIDAEKLENIN